VKFSLLFSNFKQNSKEDFYQQNKCFNSNTCYVCKRIEESKEDFTKKRVKREKREKYIKFGDGDGPNLCRVKK